MSHIAAALAKSKGKNVPLPPGESGKAGADLPVASTATPILPPGSGKITPLPIVTPAPTAGATPTAAAVAAKPRSTVSTPTPKRGRLIAIFLACVVIAGASAWLFLGKGNSAAPSAPPAQPATPPAATPAPAATIDPPAAEAPAKTPSPLLAEKVRLLAVTHAAGGGSQRLNVSGKVFEPGDVVVEGLILQSIENEEIIFRDTEGNLYTRRL